ncbi:DUF202 domain-containing protein [Candidatus Woesearchaeota archaeon]|nr:DUF202 domain-containing protein [Candidatus Woesearchaeota archaeon]
MHPEKRAHLHFHFDRERTFLANERTMLSYVRTCFALIFAGFAIMRFFEWSKTNESIAYILIITGILVGILGVALFIHRRRTYDHITDN